MPKDLRDSVVVITGASSGIGRATALAFAREGARLVLGARSEKNLRETAFQCQEYDAETLVVRTDVSREKDVRNLAQRAVKEFGGIDVWVNDAGVGFYSRFADAPEKEYRQVIETNLFGSVYGARAALKEFERQGSGVLINISSQIALGGAKYASAYAISKYGVRGLSDSVRQEYLDTGIDVCTVYPASTDTPFFQNAGNYTGRKLKPLGNISDVEEVAEAIVNCAREPQPDVLVGKTGYLSEPLHWFAPRTHSKVMARKAEKEHFQKEPERKKKGNLYEPASHASTHGGWQESNGHAGKIGAGIGAAAGAAALLLLWKKRGKRPEMEEVA